MDYEKVAAKIKRNEGLSVIPYKDVVGVLTIGYGHNLERGISTAAADFLLRDDIDTAVREVKAAFAWWWKLNDARQYVLVDMAFNIGVPRLRGFKKMLAAIERGDYATAAAELLDSKYARTVGRRATENARILESGDF